MAVEVTGSSNRLVVNLSFTVDGELVQLYCVNPDTGDVSTSGISQNDGTGFVTYPAGYEGVSEITVTSNHGSTDTGVVRVTADGAATVDPDATPEHPIELPEFPDVPKPPDPGPPLYPAHPIVLPPDMGFNPPPSEYPPHPEPNE